MNTRYKKVFQISHVLLCVFGIILLFITLILIIKAWIPATHIDFYPLSPAGVEISIPRNINAININTASREDFLNLPGIGKVTADAIISFRADHGPFRYVEDLLQVSGIGTKKLETIRDLVYVSP